MKVQKLRQICWQPDNSLKLYPEPLTCIAVKPGLAQTSIYARSQTPKRLFSTADPRGPGESLSQFRQFVGRRPGSNDALRFACPDGAATKCEGAASDYVPGSGERPLLPMTG